jgi:poly(3-hydroxybutyrate) depolymerase
MRRNMKRSTTVLGLCWACVAVVVAGCTTCVGGTEPPRKDTARMAQRARPTPERTPPAAQTRELVVDGQKRSYWVQTPKDYSATQSYPLIVLLTAEGETPSNFSDRADILGGAAKLGYLLSVPMAGANGWVHGACGPKAPPSSAGVKPAERGNAAASGDSSAADARAIDALVDELGKQYRVKDTYLVGRGNGALLAQRIASENPGKIAGLAVVSSPADCKLEGLAPPKHGVSVLVIDSAASPSVGTAKPKSAPASTTESNAARFWTTLAGCGSSTTEALRTEYACQGGTRVTHIQIVGLGDAWPHKVGKEFTMRTLDGFFRHLVP